MAKAKKSAKKMSTKRRAVKDLSASRAASVKGGLAVSPGFMSVAGRKN